MPFVKGHKLAKGRIKGSKNNPELASMKKLLEDAFLRNQSAAIAKIDQMFQGDDLVNFKWVCELKASMEPKNVQHTGDFSFRHMVEQLGQSKQAVSSTSVLQVEQKV